LVGWLADVQHWRRPTIGNAQLHFFNFFFLFFSFLAGLMGKRACGREHILCERAVALSTICTRQTKPTARAGCGFASTPDYLAEQPRAIACARMLRMLRPMFSFPKLLFRRPHTVIAATVVACIIVARIIMVVVVSSSMRRCQCACSSCCCSCMAGPARQNQPRTHLNMGGCTNEPRIDRCLLPAAR
jgi:hypothetical protein